MPECNRSGFIKDIMKIRGLLLAMGMSLATIGAQAADQDGKFAAKGAARKTCSEFDQAAKEQGNDYLLYGGWVEGYVSAYNQFQQGNYDITPWQTTELMLRLLQRHCQMNPNVKFLDALNSFILTVFPIRLEQESQMVKVVANDSTTYYYLEIIKRAKARLKSLGYYEGEINEAEFNADDVKVFSEYQKKQGIQVTGIPDQRTLLRLFLTDLKK